jgi:hypothetical protein
MRPAPVVSANFLERIAQPASRFHSDYLTYKRGGITRGELIARLPHIALVGDSVCMDFHISSVASSQLLAARRFPDLILLAIGHNNVDWAWYCPANELERPENRLQEQSQHFRDNFARQLKRLVEGARLQRHRVAIVVYGLVNFEAYFKGRELAEQLRTSDSALYPHLETTYSILRHFGRSTGTIWSALRR